MAVFAGIYGQEEPEYAGCVLSTWERNGYDDSDYYATVWDEDLQKVIDVEYDTTRAGGGGWAEIDATTEVLRKAYRYYYNISRAIFDNRWNINQAKEVKKGDKVIIIKGRKVPVGTVATCFWAGVRYNRFAYRDEKRLGIEVDGERIFIAAENAEPVDWENRLIHGKQRKERIRKGALGEMPFWVWQSHLRGDD